DRRGDQHRRRQPRIRSRGRGVSHDAMFHPDVVVLNFDFRGAVVLAREVADGWLARHSEALVFLASGADALQRLGRVKRRWDEEYLALFDGPGWTEARAAVHRLAEFCRERNMKLFIAVWPELHDVRHYRLGRVTELARLAAQEENAAFLDLLPAV